MWTLLAQTAAAGESAKQLSSSAFKALRSASGFPFEQYFMDFTARLDYLQAGLFVAIGLACLLYGWKIFKVLVLVNAALVGVLAGHLLDQRFAVGWWLTPVGGVVLAVLAWPLMRYAVCLLGGLAGAVLGAFVARSLMLTGPLIGAGALIGLVTMGLLAFIVFRAIVICFTSMQGSLLTVAGVVAGIARFQNMSSTIDQGLTRHQYLLPVLVVIPALIGFVYQIHRGDGKGKG